MKNYKETCKLLLERGAAVDAESKLKAKRLSLEDGYTEIEELLELTLREQT